MFIVEMLLDFVVGLFAPDRKDEVRNARESGSVRRSQARLERAKKPPA